MRGLLTFRRTRSRSRYGEIRCDRTLYTPISDFADRVTGVGGVLLLIEAR